jgi:hypothetical protein
MKERIFIPLMYILVASMILYFLRIYFLNIFFEDIKSTLQFGICFVNTIITALCYVYIGFALAVIFCPTFEVFAVDVFSSKAKRKKLEQKLKWQLYVSDMIIVVATFWLMGYGSISIIKETEQIKQVELAQNGIVQKALVANVSKSKRYKTNTVTFYAQIGGKSVKSQLKTTANLVENDTLLVRISAKKPMIAELIEVFPID